MVFWFLGRMQRFTDGFVEIPGKEEQCGGWEGVWRHERSLAEMGISPTAAMSLLCLSDWQFNFTWLRQTSVYRKQTFHCSGGGVLNM